MQHIARHLLVGVLLIATFSLFLVSCDQTQVTAPQVTSPENSPGVPGELSKVDATTRSYLLGVEPVEGPDKAIASNGDTIIITGSGTLTPSPRSVTGSGNFVHKNSSGGVLATGTWTATQLIAFVSYGTLPPPDDNLEGGKATIRVTLSPSGGGSLDAVLQAHCLLGSPPPSANEGIRLAVQDVINFNREVQGQTVFIKLP